MAKPFGGQSMDTVNARIKAQDKTNTPHFMEIPMTMGVFMTTHRSLSNKAHNEFESKRLYPIADKSGPNQTHMNHITFNRVSKNRGKLQTIHRGGRCWGSIPTICNFLGAQHLAEANDEQGFMGQTKLATTALFCERPQTLGQEVVYDRPYVDMDFKVRIHELKSDEAFALMDNVRQRMATYIKERTNITAVVCRVFHNNRRLDETMEKWSFHLHWPQVIMKNHTDLHALMMQFNKELPNQPNGKPLLDTSVYSGPGQLFRLPACGKDGDSTAVFKEVEEVKDGRWVVSQRPVQDQLADAWTHTNDPSGFVELVHDKTQRCEGQVEPTTTGIVPIELEDLDALEDILGFYGPVFSKFLVPNFIRFRQGQAKELGVACAWPDLANPDKLVLKIERLEGHSMSFRITINGDTFCEYDHGSTPHAHDFKFSKVSYVVDLNVGRISQSCVGCKPAAHTVKWYSFLSRGDLTFKIIRENMTDGLACDELVVDKGSKVVSFILNYYFETIVYSEEAKQLYVYNEKTGIWLDPPSGGNALLLGKLEDLNEKYRTSLSAVYNYRRLEQMTKWIHEHPEHDANSDEYKKAKEKQDDICKHKNANRGLIWQLGINRKRNGLAESMIDDHHPHSVFRMDSNNFIVPYENGMCVDVNTFVSRHIRPDDYFVAAFSANLVDCTSETALACKQWMFEVAGQDPELLLYKMRDFGYSFTMLMCDRAFYICYGPAGRNGKGCENLLLDLISMSTSPKRGFYFKDNYLTVAGQSKESATGCDGQKCDMRNKSLGRYDEALGVALCHTQLKKLSSGDPVTARNLHAKDTQIPITMKVKIYCNSLPNIDMSETSTQDRCTMVPYNGTWCSNAEEKRTMEPNPEKKKNIYEEIADFKDRIIPTYKDPFFSLSLYEFHLWLASLPRDADNAARPVLARLPRPKAVLDLNKIMLESQNHTLKFKNEYLVPKVFPAQDLSADVAFSQAQQFFKNHNIARRMTKAQFEDQLTKLGVEFKGPTTTKPKRLVGLSMKMAVPVYFDPTSGLAQEGDTVIPGPVTANNFNRKRGRDEDDMYN
jgi:hypothetical protein